jgi:hypothetical protein
VVDVANVMGARADGWWRDRAGAALRLCREVMALAARGAGLSGPWGERPAAAWVLVLEGRARDAAERLPDGTADSTADGTADSTADGAADGAVPVPVPVRVLSAPASGDDAIVGVVAKVTDSGGNCLVVTADRELRRRREALDAAVVGPAWLLRLLSPGNIKLSPSPMHDV